MKSIIFSLSLILSSQAFAGKILDCNIPSGDLQQVTVIESGGQLKLNELDNAGSMHSRAISREELNSGKIKLFTRSANTVGTLTRDNDGWFFTFVSPGWREGGIADCE